jgi:hypothetical protein
MCAALAKVVEVEEPTIMVAGDPEFFVEQRGTIISSRGLLGGTKKKPTPLTYGSVQEDNIMLEFNIIPAAERDEFLANIDNIWGEISGKLIEFDATLSRDPEVEMDDRLAYLKEAQEFGCAPDYDAWRGCANEKPDLDGTRWRFAAGHIHTSVGRKMSWDEQRNCAKWMDATVGVYCTLYDHAVRRQPYYGTAGRFRPTKYAKDNYGIEYRVPSNFWVGTGHAKFIFSLTKWAMEKGLTNEFHSSTVGIEEAEVLIPATINDHDTERALYLFTRMMTIHKLVI